MENIGTRTWAEIKRLRVIDRWIEIKSFSYTHIIIILSWLERRRRRDRERESLEQTDRLTEWKTTKFVRNVQFKERERETKSAWEKEREGETVYTWWGSKRESEREQDCMRKKKRERERGREGDSLDSFRPCWDVKIFCLFNFHFFIWPSIHLSFFFVSPIRFKLSFLQKDLNLELSILPSFLLCPSKLTSTFIPNTLY